MYVPALRATVPTVRARTMPTAVQYVLRTDIRTNFTADVRTYIYIYNIYILYVHEVRHNQQLFEEVARLFAVSRNFFWL